MKENNEDNIQNGIKHIVETILGTEDQTAKYKEADIRENSNMALISYLIPPVPFIVERSSKYVRFHSNQGMNNFAWLILLMLFMWVVDVAFAWDNYIKAIRIIIVVLYIILSVIGIYNVINNKAREIPLAGKVNFIDIFSGLFGK